MIVLLLSCSMSYAQSKQTNDTSSFSSTGEIVSNDSALIPIELLRVANGKMVELEYEKEINRNLVEIVHNDSIIIDAFRDSLNNSQIRCNEEVKKIKRQRNIIGGSLGASTLVSIILLIVAIL